MCGTGFALKGNLNSTHDDTQWWKTIINVVCVGLDLHNVVAWKCHMMTHTDEKPLLCSLCGTRCRTNGHLKVHMMSKHTGERPYKCSVCGAGFLLTSNLKEHMMSKHTGERPYKCSLCGTGFTQSSSLKVHMMRHTGEKPFKCSLCGAGFCPK